jgi:soluble lytic murein transglycosylase-like protein
MKLIATLRKPLLALSFATAGVCLSVTAFAGAQTEEALSASVQAVLQRAVSDQAPLKMSFASQKEADVWLSDMSKRLSKRIPDQEYREDLLKTVHYEATRAGLDPHLVLGLIEVESGFRKYAVSNVGARGYMQVMPFWTKILHAHDQDLFHLRTNLRYGCTILRYYVDIEKGNLYRALGRYNGSLGKPEYPNLVRAAWHKHWSAPQRTASSQAGRSG